MKTFVAVTLAAISLLYGSPASAAFTFDLNDPMSFEAGNVVNFNVQFDDTSLPLAVCSWEAYHCLPDTITASYTANGNGRDAQNVKVMSVPEPQTYSMLAAGLGILGAVARRRSHST